MREIHKCVTKILVILFKISKGAYRGLTLTTREHMRENIGATREPLQLWRAKLSGKGVNEEFIAVKTIMK